MAHVLAFHAGARQRFLDDQRAQVGGGDVLEAATKVPMAVRTALTTTTSRVMGRSLLK